MYLRWYGISLFVWDVFCVTIKFSSGREQKYTSIHIQFLVWDTFYDHSEANQKSKSQRKEFTKKTTSTQSYSKSMETQLRSSGTFSEDSHRCRFSKKIRKDLGVRQRNPGQFGGIVIFMSMSMTLIGKTKEILQNVFRIPRRPRTTQKRFRVDIGHSSVQEKKTNGMERTFTNWKENVAKMLIFWFNTLKRVVTQYSEVSVRSPKGSQRKGRSTIHFTAESSNIEFSFRTIHAANQSDVYGASSWCQDSTEKILVKHFRMWTSRFQEIAIRVRKSWIRKNWMFWFVIRWGLREQLETACNDRRFKALDTEDQFRKMFGNQQDLWDESLVECATQRLALSLTSGPIVILTFM